MADKYQIQTKAYVDKAIKDIKKDFKNADKLEILKTKDDHISIFVKNKDESYEINILLDYYLESCRILYYVKEYKKLSNNLRVAVFNLNNELPITMKCYATRGLYNLKVIKKPTIHIVMQEFINSAKDISKKLRVFYAYLQSESVKKLIKIIREN